MSSKCFSPGDEDTSEGERGRWEGREGGEGGRKGGRKGVREGGKGGGGSLLGESQIPTLNHKSLGATRERQWSTLRLTHKVTVLLIVQPEIPHPPSLPEGETQMEISMQDFQPQSI